MNRRTGLVALTVLVLIALGIAIYLQRKPPPLPTLHVGGMTITPLDRTMGDPASKVVMIEYAAPQCPVCARFNATAYQRLKAEYIDTGKIFYVLRVFPIGPADIPAEGIARCLPKERYFPFIDQLFRNQQSWDPEYGVSDVAGQLTAQARIAGLSENAARSCMLDKANQDRIVASVNDAMQRYNVNGTPTFVVNNQVVFVGDYPWDKLKAMLDAKLAKKP